MHTSTQPLPLDTVFLRALALEVLIGVAPWERAPQTLLLDIDLCGDVRPAAASDDVAQAWSYAEVAERLRADLSTRRFGLLEALAEHVAAFLLAQFPSVARVMVRVVKPAILPDVGEVGVCIHRSR